MSFTFDDEPVYKIGDSFTMRNILNIVDKMNAAMPHYEFEPEPVCEGGIRVKQDGQDTRRFVSILTTGLILVAMVLKWRISIQS
jgi:hypothetical protein